MGYVDIAGTRYGASNKYWVR